MVDNTENLDFCTDTLCWSFAVSLSVIRGCCAAMYGLFTQMYNGGRTWVLATESVTVMRQVVTYTYIECKANINHPWPSASCCEMCFVCLFS